jgi:putative zinc finger protein
VTSHASAASLAAYAAGDPALDDAGAWAVEAHLEGCAECRSRLVGLPSPGLPELLEDVQVRIDRGVRNGPQPTRKRAWRRRAHRWSAWAFLPWAALTVVAVFTAFLLDRNFPERPSLVLLLAPVAPLGGLAAAWSRRSDPAWETIAGTARAGIELLLRRTLVVLATVIPPLALTGWYLGKSPALWLLPCLTFTATTLLLGGWIGVARAAAILSGAWLVVVAAPAVVTESLPVLIRPAGVPGWLAAAAILTVLTVLRAVFLQSTKENR